MSKKQEPVISVAVVEDNADVRESLREILDGTGGIRCVAACPSGERALADLPALKPRVVLMDIGLPGMDGVECLRRLAVCLPGVLVVMLTVHDDTDRIFESLTAGACGYLHKPVHAEELIAAVQEVHHGGSPMTGSVARKVVLAFRASAPAVKAGCPPENELTEREQAVLEYLSQGFLYKEIADELGVSWHTVHTHIRHVYEKLHVRSRGEAVAKCFGR
jgi:DNA-binding NarL/FixJ family response regulator